MGTRERLGEMRVEVVQEKKIQEGEEHFVGGLSSVPMKG